MQTILKWDQGLLKLINSEWNNAFFDLVLPFFRIAEFWIPFYFFLLLVALINFRTSGLKWALFLIGTAVFCNFVSSDLIKPNIIRLRPCNDPELFSWLRVLVAYRPQSSSFTSSHAANHFGAAMFLYITLQRFTGKKAIAFFIWAAIICYSQLYVGVHYPIDVICGGVVGSVIGYMMAKIFNNKIGLKLHLPGKG